MIVYTVQDSDQQTPLRHPSVMIFEEAASSDLTPGNWVEKSWRSS